MKTSTKVILLATCVIAIGIIGFVFFVYGGAEKFEEPIQVVLPESYSGLLCATLVTATVPRGESPKLHYEVSNDGSFEIDKNLVTSHRPKQFYRRSPGTSPPTKVLDSEWFPVRTENSSRGVAYGVYWIGTREAWQSFSNGSGNKPFCPRG